VMFLYLKALHIIFVVNWFAGLFYMPRLFIYTREAHDKEEPSRSVLLQQNLLMQWRLWYIITWPSAIITLVLGLYMIHLYGGFPTWLLWKLGFVAALYIYHYVCHRIFLQQQNDIFSWTSKQLRIWNEVATILLFIIVFLVVVKNQISMMWAIIGVFVLSILLMTGIRIYDRIRKDEFK
jgi:putative membrane protein